MALAAGCSESLLEGAAIECLTEALRSDGLPRTVPVMGCVACFSVLGWVRLLALLAAVGLLLVTACLTVAGGST
jgi:hypothetical protein